MRMVWLIYWYSDLWQLSKVRFFSRTFNAGATDWVRTSPSDGPEMELITRTYEEEIHDGGART